MDNLFGGQLWICCHVVDYGFDKYNIPVHSDLIEEIEIEISKVIELEICKNISHGELSIDILYNKEVHKIMGWWEIRK